MTLPGLGRLDRYRVEDVLLHRGSPRLGPDDRRLDQPFSRRKYLAARTNVPSAALRITPRQSGPIPPSGSNFTSSARRVLRWRYLSIMRLEVRNEIDLPPCDLQPRVPPVGKPDASGLARPRRQRKLPRRGVLHAQPPPACPFRWYPRHCFCTHTNRRQSRRFLPTGYKITPGGGASLSSVVHRVGGRWHASHDSYRPAPQIAPPPFSCSAGEPDGPCGRGLRGCENFDLTGGLSVLLIRLRGRLFGLGGSGSPRGHLHARGEERPGQRRMSPLQPRSPTNWLRRQLIRSSFPKCIRL